MQQQKYDYYGQELRIGANIKRKRKIEKAMEFIKRIRRV